MNQAPPGLKRHFPETRWEDLDAQAHRDAFLERILEYGDRDEIQWGIATYGQEAIRNFLRQKGARRLSKRSLNFWCMVWGVDKIDRHPWPSAAEALWGR